MNDFRDIELTDDSLNGIGSIDNYNINVSSKNRPTKFKLLLLSENTPNKLRSNRQ